MSWNIETANKWSLDFHFCMQEFNYCKVKVATSIMVGIRALISSSHFAKCKGILWNICKNVKFLRSIILEKQQKCKAKYFVSCTKFHLVTISQQNNFLWKHLIFFYPAITLPSQLSCWHNLCQGLSYGIVIQEISIFHFSQHSFSNLSWKSQWIFFSLTLIAGKSCVLLSSVQKFIEIEALLLLVFSFCLNNQISYRNFIGTS